MILRRAIHIYNCEDKYLYEIVEDYKECDSEEMQSEIFQSFCSSIWSCDNKRRTYKRTIHFSVKKDLLNTELGQVFDTWSSVEYKYYKPMTKSENWQDLLRQKINNIYTRYFDKEVILGKEYMDLLKTPKKLYYRWIDGEEMDADTVTEIIDDAIDESEKVKEKLQMQKMVLSWDKYKEVVEGFLKTAFKNCKLIGDYEDKTSISSRFDYLTEDHFYISYINKCLNGAIKDYEKRYYNLPQSSRNGYKRCKLCGAIIENDSKNRQYCLTCKKRKRQQINHNYYIKTVLKSEFLA